MTRRRRQWVVVGAMILLACTDTNAPPAATKPAAASLLVSGLPTSVTAGTVVSGTIIATGASGDTAIGYGGTVHFTSTDPAAQLPPDHTFVPADRGSYAFTVTFKTAGAQMLTAIDLAESFLSGRATVTVTARASAPERIAFQSSRGIEVIGADGLGRAVLIVDSTAFEPAWSADGARLAFTRRVPDSGSTCEIYTARADGSDERKITTPLTQPWCAYSPAWSPDGTKIAFTAGEGQCVDGMYCWTGSIYVVNADGSNERQLFYRLGPLPHLTEYPNFRWIGLSFPKWSPDGGMIAFTCDATNGGDDLWWVCIGAADGSGATRLPDLVAESPAWSPDGSEIASSSSVTSTSIILRNADGSGVARTLTTPGPCPPCSFLDFDPAWSPDGTQLVFTRATGDRFFPPFISDLFIINRDGTGLRRLTTTGDASRPTWRSATPLPLPRARALTGARVPKDALPGPRP
jgi:TolB protein